jgi:hypothetical protein
MEKLLTTLFLQAVFKDVKTTKALVDIIFNENTEPKVVKNRVVNKSLPIKPRVVNKQIIVKEVVPTNNKQQEVMDAIQFLKDKKKKFRCWRLCLKQFKKYYSSIFSIL